MITPLHKLNPATKATTGLPANALVPNTSQALKVRRATPVALICTRMLTLPLACIALWFHGQFGLVVSVGIMLATWFWMDAIGHALPVKLSSQNGIKQASYGEMILLNHQQVQVPSTDLKTTRVFWLVAAVSGLCALMAAYFNQPILLGSSILVYWASRCAFWMRMANLFQRMQNAHPLYRFWSVEAQNDNAPRRTQRRSA
ncbi:hypothetical protein TRICHSKD4_5537 [Roseibium sp. TrichSKD4]|uniref:DUF6653 family protein n=1 Tax=Roseibium sp. TrichSKD4 TaxID=744980 RepID=UPI0001E57274|nr:DUF6653 family protein [Roseibium sp. TrichSKD4]EFO29704.1 hypothetical protein TRICHSKD4_5537 [Roseibium sp. TrichSKD4]